MIAEEPVTFTGLVWLLDEGRKEERVNIRTRREWEQSSVTVSDLIESLAHLAGCQQPEMDETLSAVIAFDKDAPCFTLIKKTGDDEVITEWRYTMEPDRMASALATAAPNHDWDSRESRGASLEKVEKRRDQSPIRYDAPIDDYPPIGVFEAAQWQLKQMLDRNPATKDLIDILPASARTPLPPCEVKETKPKEQQSRKRAKRKPWPLHQVFDEKFSEIKQKHNDVVPTKKDEWSKFKDEVWEAVRDLTNDFHPVVKDVAPSQYRSE